MTNGIARAGLLPVAAMALHAAPARADDGAALFEGRCAMCHSVTPDAGADVGPNLRGVAGRKAGSTDFGYSAALRKSGIVWTKTTLDAFLAAPQKLVPGTQMVVAIPDAAQRAAVVRYLVSLK